MNRIAIERGNSRRAPLLLLVAATLASCSVGPLYKTGHAHAPEAFQSTAAEDPAFPATSSDAAWWRALGNPLLDQLVDKAFADNRDLRAALARIDQARAAAGAAAAELWPQLDARAGYTRTRTTEATPSPVRGITFDSFVLGFDASWELDLFGRLRKESDARTLELRATAADAAGVRLTLAAEVTAAYAELHGALRRHAIAADSVRAAEELLQLTRARADGGLGTDLDSTRAERLLAATRARLPVFDREWHRAAFRLAVLTGEQPGTLVEQLRTAPPLATVPDVVGIGIPADVVRNRPDLEAAERRLEAAYARVGAAMAERYPSIGITGFLGLESNRTSTWFEAGSRAWNVGPAVRLPLFNGGSIEQRIAIREAELDEALHGVQQRALLAFEEVENAITGLRQERRRRSELDAAVAAAERARTLAAQRFDAGLDDFLGVIDAEQARLDLADQQAAVGIELVRQFAALHKALGGGAPPAPEGATTKAGD